MFATDAGLDAGTEAMAWGAAPHDDLDHRQLRHHMKNVLQRIISILEASPDLKSTMEGTRLAREVARRICMAAEMSDAMLGLARAPGPFEARLRDLSNGVVELLSDPDQIIDVEIEEPAVCPAEQHGLVLRVAQELVGNAAKHGFHARLLGKIRISVTSGPHGTRLVVADNGWGFGHRPQCGQGLKIAQALIAPFGGVLELRSRDGITAEMRLPLDPRGH